MAIERKLRARPWALELTFAQVAAPDTPQTRAILADLPDPNGAR